MRQLELTYSHAYRYPLLDETQLTPFRLLKVALEEDRPMPDLLSLYHSACFSMFAHHKHKFLSSKYLDQFFSPVICFLVLSSYREKGGFQLPTVITGCIAQIMYSIRATMFTEIRKKADEDDISIWE